MYFGIKLVSVRMSQWLALGCRIEGRGSNLTIVTSDTAGVSCACVLNQKKVNNLTGEHAMLNTLFLQGTVIM